MNLRKLNDEISVSEQIDPRDVPAIAAAGFRSIICNRPDDEGWGQASFAEIEAAAAAAGLESAYLPVFPGQMNGSQVERFSALMRDLPGPVLAYCRSGARAAGLWDAAHTTKAG